MKHFAGALLFILSIGGFAQQNAPAALHAASDNELFTLAAHAEPEVQIEIARELVERKSPKVTELFKILLTREPLVKAKDGDSEYETTAAAELFRFVAFQKEKADRKKYYEATTKKAMKQELQSLFGQDYDTKWSVSESDNMMGQLAEVALLADLTSAHTVSAVCKLSHYKQKNYNRIKYYAGLHPTPEILATLANFKKPADVATLQQNMPASYLGISFFPNATLFPKLQANAAKDFENGHFQLAVAVYKTPAAKTVLDNMCTSIVSANPVKSIRNEKLFQLYSGIEKQNTKLYAGLLKKIDALMMK